MKNNNFLKVISYIPFLKDIFKTQLEWNNEFNNLIESVKNNDVDKFEKNFNNKNPFLSFNYLAIEAIKLNSNNLFYKIEEEAVKAKKTTEKPFFNMKKNFMSYDHVFYTAIVQNNADVIKYLVKKNCINIEKFNTNTIYDIAKVEAFNVLHYLLFDLKLAMSKETIQILECDFSGKKHIKALAMIENRDLYSELNQNLDNSKDIKKTKINKL